MNPNLQQIVKQLIDLSKLLNKGTSLKLEVNGTTWYAVKNVEKFEKEIFNRHAQRVQKEMFGDMQNSQKGFVVDASNIEDVFNAVKASVGAEIRPQVSETPPVKEKPLKLPLPSHIKKLGGDEAVLDFAKRYKVFHDIKRNVFVKKI